MEKRKDVKYIICLGDGMSDEPMEELQGRTPLEVASTPMMDQLSKKGEVGMVQTIPEGMKPGSDTANLAVMGYDPRKYYSGRSPLEALSIGVPMKEDDIALANWYTNELQRLGVEVHMNTTITAKDVLESDYDTVIMATGSTPKVFSLGDDEHVYTAAQVLMKEKNPGETTVVVGGGLVGCETALWLAKAGKKVTIVEALDKIMKVNGPICHSNKDMLELLLPFHNVEIITGAKVKGYENGKLSVETAEGMQELACDSVILSVGYNEENALYHEVEFEVPEIYLLGDAKKVANIMYAIWDAFEVANHI